MIKKCNTCLEEKDISSFSKDSKSKDLHTFMCKVCKNRSDKEYRRLNKDKISKTKLECYLKNKEHYKSYWKDRYESNKEVISELHKAYYENNKEVIRERAKQYYLDNKGRFNAWSKKYKLRKAQRTPKWLTKEDYLLMESFYDLAQKLTMETGVVHHVDHIIPLVGKNELGEHVVCGLNVPANLRIITATENQKKWCIFKEDQLY